MMAKKLYLSAAAHAADNATACPVSCSENTHCNAYMDLVEARMRAHGVEVRRGAPALTGDIAMAARVKEANSWGADLYYVAHTNAGAVQYDHVLGRCRLAGDGRDSAQASQECGQSQGGDP